MSGESSGDAPGTAANALGCLIEKYRAIADLTKPRCLGDCPEPGGCCKPEYCDLAAERARQFGIALSPQAHPTLRFMGAAGCVVPPHLRPLCAVHVCEFHVIREAEFAEEYLGLREEICRLEEQLDAPWPTGMARHYWE